MLSMCCIDKTLAGWNLERVASICRERCGGQGYLAVNKFTDYLNIAHAAMTAEGDNRVLMVKIVKDITTNYVQKGHSLPKMSLDPKQQISKLKDVTSLEVLEDLLIFREITLYNAL